MSSTVSPNMIAEHILWLRKGQATTPLHIVKLVYLCHGWMLGIKGRPLVNEPIVTGKYGPVLQSVYDQYSIFGDGQIDLPGADHSKDLDPLQLAIVDFVHSAYQEFPDTALSEITHEPGTPWSEVFDEKGVGVEIPMDLVQQHYNQLVVNLQRIQQGGDRNE